MNAMLYNHFVHDSGFVIWLAPQKATHYQHSIELNSKLFLMDIHIDT